MPELLDLPDPDLSSREKALYCRAQSANFRQRAALAKDVAEREEFLALARRWSALAGYHEAEMSQPTSA